MSTATALWNEASHPAPRPARPALHLEIDPAELFAADGTIGTVAAAELLGITFRQIDYWARQWHGYIRSGHRRRLTRVDLLVARAWQRLYDGRSGGETIATRHAREAAESAIRANPQRWLLLTADGASTHPNVGDAALTWDGMGMASIIDCNVHGLAVAA